MTAKRVIRIDEEVHAAIVKQGNAADTVNSVLRRVLKLDGKKTTEKVRPASS